MTFYIVELISRLLSMFSKTLWFCNLWVDSTKACLFQTKKISSWAFFFFWFRIRQGKNVGVFTLFQKCEKQDISFLQRIILKKADEIHRHIVLMLIEMLLILILWHFRPLYSFDVRKCRYTVTIALYMLYICIANAYMLTEKLPPVSLVCKVQQTTLLILLEEIVL